jgi:hypothetical protein
MTPANEIRNWSASLCQKMPMMLATITPMRPMNANWPTPARLRAVVVPYIAIAPNMTAATTKAFAIEAPV